MAGSIKLQDFLKLQPEEHVFEEKGKVGILKIWRFPANSILVTEIIGLATQEIANRVVLESQNMIDECKGFIGIHHWVNVNRIPSESVKIINNWCLSLSKQRNRLNGLLVSYNSNIPFFCFTIESLAQITGFKNPQVVKTEVEFLKLIRSYFDREGGKKR